MNIVVGYVDNAAGNAALRAGSAEAALSGRRSAHDTWPGSVPTTSRSSLS